MRNRPKRTGALVTVFALVAMLFGVVPAQGLQPFNNAAIADAGLAEIGTSRPTGWNQPGECIKSVQRWVAAAGGHFGGGGVISGYVNSGAQEVSLATAVKGDVIQYTNANGDDNDWSKVHTMVVVTNHGNGRFDIVQSNAPAGSGKVTRVNNMVPNPDTGWISRVWRFGTVQSTPQPPTVQRDDLLWASPSAGGTQVDALLSTSYTWSLGWRGENWTTPSHVESGDFNGDGKDDLVYVIATDASTVDANTLTSTGSGWTTSWSVSGWSTPSVIVSGEFDGS